MTQPSELRHDLEKNIPEWLESKKRLIKDKSIEWLKEFNEDQNVTPKIKLIASRYERLALWFRMNYMLSGIGATPDVNLLAFSSRAQISSFLFEIPIYDFYPKNLGRYSFDTFGKLLAQVLATGWKDEAELIARLGFKELNRLMDRGISYGRMSWFMLELTKDWLNADVSLDSDFRQHEVEDLGVWDKLLDGWKEPNERKFDALMSEMADYHLSQSKDAGMSETEWYEFEDMSYWLFPVELLAVLRLREWVGIGNPTLSHPIFSVTPIGSLYPSPEWPKDEVLDTAEAKFRSIYPDTPSVADLSRHRREQ
ncbi:hypothetical protein GOZ90_19685 [Agrobacterium vitis]|uniref:Uncharacterized protein n=1 Tax=Agrobacterium vitis TaxID=373 RepID=A0A6L6VH30_AGRVI|nr:hypothetical protein [Agrobacterium vitis]MUZ74914.1 hypothetical protein [Agrobacterium vitis]MVA19935.1 hypothetical protein [Agrobacterium vitis]